MRLLKFFQYVQHAYFIRNVGTIVMDCYPLQRRTILCRMLNVCWVAVRCTVLCKWKSHHLLMHEYNLWIIKYNIRPIHDSGSVKWHLQKSMPLNEHIRHLCYKHMKGFKMGIQMHAFRLFNVAEISSTARGPLLISKDPLIHINNMRFVTPMQTKCM
jgi:hypothetical protein